MTFKLLALALAVSTAMTGPSAAAAKLVVGQDGKLLGASGVLVQGKIYSVEFVDGNCKSTYNDCSTNNFDFTAQISAMAAGQALLDQVLLDGSDGDFDSKPDQVKNIYNPFGSEFYIPYASSFFDDINLVSFIAVINTYPDDRGGDYVVNQPNTPDFYLNTTNNRAATYARFILTEQVGAVPEPATWMMMLVGFGLIGATARYRRRHSTVRYA